MKLFLETFIALSPLYAFIFTGVLLKRTGVITDTLIPALNRIVFRAFLPITLFLNVYEAELNFGNSIDVIAYSVSAFILLFGVLALVVPRFIKDKPRAATTVQGMFRSNFVLLGIVYARQLFGADRMGETGLLIAVIVPLFNVLAVLTFALLTGEKQRPADVLLKIVKNPLIVAAVTGLFVRAVGIELPSLLLNPLSTLGDVATPFAMVVIGSSLTLAGFRRDGLLIGVLSFVRLIVVPAVFVTGAALLGFREVILVALLTAFGGPCAVSSPAMAYQLGGDGELAGEFVAATTLFSLPTMYLFIVLLRALGLC